HEGPPRQVHLEERLLHEVLRLLRRVTAEEAEQPGRERVVDDRERGRVALGVSLHGRVGLAVTLVAAHLSHHYRLRCRECQKKVPPLRRQGPTGGTALDRGPPTPTFPGMETLKKTAHFMPAALAFTACQKNDADKRRVDEVKTEAKDVKDRAEKRADEAKEAI